MFALQGDRRPIAVLVSVATHTGLVVAALAGARRVSPAARPILVLPESALVVAPGPAAPVAPVVDRITAPLPDPDPLTLPPLPGVPILQPATIAIPGAGGGTPITGLGGGDPGFVPEALADEPPALLSAPVPAYPPLLRQAGIQGSVVVRAVVDTMGRAEPTSLHIVDSPNPGFDRVALDCVRQALFRPGRVRGRAVRVLVSVPVHFTLRP